PQLIPLFRINKDLRNIYTQQIDAGFDYALGNNTISASYTFVRGIKIYALRNINPIVRPIPGDPLGSAITGRPDPTIGDFMDFESAFDSYYHGFTVSINRRLANHFGLLAHYTFSKAIDDYIDFRVDIVRVNDSLNPRGERGLSVQDVRSRFVF